MDIKTIQGGVLLQEHDNKSITKDDLKIVTKASPKPQQMDDLLFAWNIVKFIKSNAIVYVRDNMSIGIGAGQMSRVFSSRIAIEKAQEANFT